jgi:hypothetical protein
VLDAVLINSNTASADAIGPGLSIDPVLPDALDHIDPRIRVVARDVVSAQNPLRHDPEKLAAVLLELSNGRWRDDVDTGSQQGQNGTSARQRSLVATNGTREH